MENDLLFYLLTARKCIPGFKQDNSVETGCFDLVCIEMMQVCYFLTHHLQNHKAVDLSMCS